MAAALSNTVFKHSQTVIGQANHLLALLPLGMIGNRKEGGLGAPLHSQTTRVLGRKNFLWRLVSRISYRHPAVPSLPEPHNEDIVQPTAHLPSVGTRQSPRFASRQVASSFAGLSPRIVFLLMAMPILASKPYSPEQFIEIDYDRPHAPTLLPRGTLPTTPAARPSHQDNGPYVFDDMTNTMLSDFRQNLRIPGPQYSPSSPTIPANRQGLSRASAARPSTTAIVLAIRGQSSTSTSDRSSASLATPTVPSHHNRGASDRSQTNNPTPTPGQENPNSPPPPPPPPAVNSNAHPQWSQHSPPWRLESRTPSEISASNAARINANEDFLRRFDIVFNGTPGNSTG